MKSLHPDMYAIWTVGPVVTVGLGLGVGQISAIQHLLVSQNSALHRNKIFWGGFCYADLATLSTLLKLKILLSELLVIMVSICIVHRCRNSKSKCLAGVSSVRFVVNDWRTSKHC